MILELLGAPFPVEVHMSLAHVVHYVGEEECHRSAILRSAGYDVRECFTERQLVHDLAEQDAELVCISEPREKPAEGALAMAHALSDAPVVLFRAGEHHYLQKGWDLEVQALQHPSVWLAEIAGLLQRKRAAIARAGELRDTAMRLRGESARVRRRSARM